MSNVQTIADSIRNFERINMSAMVNDEGDLYVTLGTKNNWSPDIRVDEMFAEDLTGLGGGSLTELPLNLVSAIIEDFPVLVEAVRDVWFKI